MNNWIWLIRASRWVRNPPSMRMVILVASIIAIAVILGTLEYFDLVPDWMQMEHGRGYRGPLPR
ncbi:MAG: hypothetical protein Q4G36_03955 [Paracoccus sp. (in: a-proteobacteria)]|nr:hypothetical protein [Paracoccus sp. (in: a-proteobacteria)]